MVPAVGGAAAVGVGGPVEGVDGGEDGPALAVDQIDPAEVVGRGGEGLLAKPYRLTDLLHAINGPG